MAATAQAFPVPGSYAPDFETQAVIPLKDNPTGKVVENFRLSSLLGKSRILLLTYPKNCTFVCPTELLALKSKLDQFHDLGFEVLVLSTDEASMDKDRKASHQAWRMKSDKANTGSANTPMGIGSADFIMISDVNRKIISTYGVEGRDGLALRATFFIDMKGRIQIADVNANSIGRDVDELLRKAAAVKYVEEHEGMVTPEGWQPGEAGMKPTHEGVRKHMKKQ
ncbi:MAG: redoxin domain-containing protein [Endozoicomonas sp.]